MLLPSKWSTQARFLKAALFGIGLALPGVAYGVGVEKKFGLTGVGCATAPRLSKDRITAGVETGLTGFFEWKFTDKLGVRSGCGYARVRVVDVANIQNNKQISCVGLTIYRVSIPLVVRFYPGEKRQFCLYSGPRFGIVVSGTQVILLHTSPNGYGGYIKELVNEKTLQEGPSALVYKLLNEFFEKKLPEKKLPRRSACKGYPSITWDWGFDYETSFGLSFGMEGVGVNLGYNFAPLFKNN